MNKKILKYMAAAITLAVYASCNDIVDYNDGYTPLEEQANAGAPVITAVYDRGAGRPDGAHRRPEPQQADAHNVQHR